MGRMAQAASSEHTGIPAARVGEVALGGRIRARRLEQGLTTIQLGRAAAISQPFVTEIERGRKSPSMATLQRIASALEVTVSELLDPVRPRSRHVPVIAPTACLAWLQGTAPHDAVPQPTATVVAEIDDPDAFFVQADGRNMTGGRVQRGDLLLVSPNAALEPGCMVLAARPDGVTLGRLQQPESSHVVPALAPERTQGNGLANEPARMHRVVRIQIDL